MTATASACPLGRNATGKRSSSSRPEHVERELRPGHVRHEQVEQPRREVQPRGLGEDRRRRERLHPGEHLGADRLLGLLEAVHRLAHDLQPGDRVLDVDGQRRAHRREPVAELVVLVAGADRDGHERAQLQPLGAHAARPQPLLQRAGDDGEHDVVDRAAERVLDLLEDRELLAHGDEPAVRADLDVERRRRRGVQPGPDDLAEPLERLARLVQRDRRAASRRRPPAPSR